MTHNSPSFTVVDNSANPWYVNCEAVRSKNSSAIKANKWKNSDIIFDTQ